LRCRAPDSISDYRRPKALAKTTKPANPSDVVDCGFLRVAVQKIALSGIVSLCPQETRNYLAASVASEKSKIFS
jgi:hypothetical protein